ncbi:MAG TPA: glycosyltransferase family A protein [Gammaproteobacteria bacterium]|nr:glycosyltransferase family A protein [Gammaproteobacteria bacterium]
MTQASVSSPLITTVIPTYQRAKLLRRAIESALEQGGPALIVHVFDNASSDGTGAVVAEIAARDTRLRYHRHASNIGAAANFEFGLRSVQTPYFSILSDDDYLLPGFYRHACEDLEAQPEAVFWAGMTLNVDEAGKIWYARVDQWAREGLFAPPEGLMAMLHGMSPVWTGIVFRRAIFDGIGYPDRATRGPSDFDFMLKAGARFKYILRKYPAAAFTLHRDSFSSTQPLSSFWPGWQQIFRNVEANGDLGPGVKSRVLSALHRDARRMLLRRAANALAIGRYDFCRDAAAAFEAQYGKGLRPIVLRYLTDVCRRVPPLQAVYTWAYRLAEHLLIRSRLDLESRFGHLIRRN